MLIIRRHGSHRAPLFGVLFGMLLATIPTSAQFRRNTNAGGAIIYRDPNFTGPSQTVRGEVADLRPSGLNDQVSSIEIPPGETWEICQDINYGNGCLTLTSSVPDLRTIGWDDRISSLRQINGGYQDRVYQDGGYQNGGYQNGGYPPDQNGQYTDGGWASQQPAQAEVILYDRQGYRGAATIITRDAYDQGARVNRRVGSVVVRGAAWQVCDRTGRCVSVSQGVTDLSQLGLNSQITSVRPIDNAWPQSNSPGGYFGNYRQ
jgi:hypothetical protein